MKVRHLTLPRPGIGAVVETPNAVTPTIDKRLIALPRFGFAVGVILVAAVGCSVGLPDGTSIQNAYGISDDISAVRMTQSDSLKIPDPNLPTTYPHSYLLPQD